MTLLELIAKAAGLGGPELVKLLQAVASAAPDLAPLADKWLMRLEDAIAPSHLIALAEDLSKEVSDIAKGHLDPRRNPSNTI